MIMFRMPIAQPPNMTRKSERKGMSQWVYPLRKNCHVSVGDIDRS